MLPGFVHCSIGLEVLFDEEFILLNHQFDIVVSSVNVLKDFIKVSSNLILLIVEFLEINSFDGMNIICHQSSKYTFVQPDYSLVLGQSLRVLDSVGKDVIDLLEAEVLYVVVRFGHFRL